MQASSAAVLVRGFVNLVRKFNLYTASLSNDQYHAMQLSSYVVDSV